jgi:uncharacterized membrane protein YbhN (UPF0104 family)
VSAPSLAVPARRRTLGPGARRAVAVAAWLVATVLVVLALRAVGTRAALDAARGARPGWLVVAALCFLGVIALWAWQSLLLLPRSARVSYRRIFEVQALTATAANTIPAFLGHATGVALLAERTGVGTAAALGVFAQHNLVEGFAKLALLLAAAQVAPLAPWMRQAVGVIAAGFGLLAVGLAGAAWAARRRAPRHEDRHLPSEAVGLTPDAAPHAADAAPSLTVAAASSGAGAERRARGRLATLGTFVVSWAAGLDALRSPRRLALAFASGLLMKVAEWGGWVAVEQAFGGAPGRGSAVLALAATNVASAVSVSPGNLGVYEGAAFAVYRALGVPPDRAMAMAVVAHLAYLVPFMGAGWAILTARQLRRWWRARRG